MNIISNVHIINFHIKISNKFESNSHEYRYIIYYLLYIYIINIKFIKYKYEI